MRHQAQPEQMTRLLIQKPKDYAELDENSRIAITVLLEDGWSIDRIGLDMTVKVSATAAIELDRSATIKQNDAMAALVQEITQTQAQFILLRERMIKVKAQLWLVAGGACLVCGGLNLAGLGGWAFTLVSLCAGGWVWQSIRHLRKGAA